MQKIILASGSPRRKEILELLGLEFEVVDSGYDEDLITTTDPVELVEELALQKALAVASILMRLLSAEIPRPLAKGG
jgi:septum formation protein